MSGKRRPHARKATGVASPSHHETRARSSPCRSAARPLLSAVGVDVLNPAHTATGHPSEQQGDSPPGRMVLSLAEVQRWLEIILGMADELPG